LDKFAYSLHVVNLMLLNGTVTEAIYMGRWCSESMKLPSESEASRLCRFASVLV
jgi:hypothetical protein